MKKTILLFLLSICFVGQSQVASCSLDPVFVASNKKGIWPDSVTNFASGVVGQPYSQNLTIKVPKDTNSIIGKMCFNRIEVSTNTTVANFNLPPGLSLIGGTGVTVTAGTYKFPGNANTCAQISGTPTTPGSYTLEFRVVPFLTASPLSPCSATPNVTGGSGSLVAPSILKYYIINIQATAGVNEQVNNRSFALNNYPNPSEGKTTLKFRVGDIAPVQVKVYNLIGSEVISENHTSVTGDNTIELDTKNLQPGIYLYSVKYKNYSETRRMVVKP